MNIQKVTVSDKTYKVINGTYYSETLPDNIIMIIEGARLDGSGLIFDFGDMVTGQSWGEEYDIKGYIGRSTGSIKIPLLLNSKKSIGGGGLTQSIVKITDKKGGLVRYQHPQYKPYKP